MDHIFHRSPSHHAERINVVRLSHAVARAVFEIIAGYRTVAQLSFVMNPDCIRKLQNQALLETDGYKQAPAPGTSHGQVQSMKLRSTLSGGWECTVILGFKYRVRAVALYIEPWHGRWQVTSVEML
ncbi:Rv3235 family protein [Glutamicibacter sp. NPDC087344]|uniref:Rv3235 family protein n=1 Tax=Glutamicibacter sp. NPDC087344 TaxID=3363994 RepID=UPI00382987E2